MPIEVLSEGWCVCIHEPRCAGGLEGYNLSGRYRYQECKGRKIGRYMRVYPEAESDYYETCGPVEFTYYFRKESQP